MDVVDEIVEKLGLPRPSNKLCADWDRYAWKEDIRTRQADCKERGWRYHELLWKNGYCLLPKDKSQFCNTFYHPTAYLTAALVEGQYSQSEIDGLVARIGAALAKAAVKFHAEPLQSWL